MAKQCESMPTATNSDTVREALEASREFFRRRDQMNAAVHLTPVRYSPVTDLVQRALDATDAADEAARG